MQRSLVLITPPTDDVVSLDEAKAQLRVTADDQDDFIQAIVTANVNYLDPAGGGWLGRALRPQVWELRMNGFVDRSGCGGGTDSRHSHTGHVSDIALPYPPLTEIGSVTYTDTAGVTQTLAADTGYRLFGVGTLGKSYLRPPYLAYWPLARYDVESVKIQYTCGYSMPEDDDPDTLPAPIRQAVLLGVKGLYDLGARNAFLTTDTVIGVSSKSWAVSDAAVAVMRNAAENLLSTYRVW